MSIQPLFPQPRPDAGHGPGRLLITGGAGFIGAALARRWIERGGGVLLLDDLSHRAPGSTGLERLAELAPERVEFVRGSVLDAPLVRELVRDCARTAHLAAVVGVGRVCADPERTAHVNAAGGRIVIEAAAAAGRPLLLTSSSEVYGPQLAPPFAEAAGPCFPASRHPRAGYAISKAYAERVALELARRVGLQLTVVRLFNTTGPGQGVESGMVLPRMVAAAVAGEPLRVHGDGRQTRCFAHVDDVSEILARLLERRGRAEVFNVGQDEEVSVGDLAQEVAARAGGARIEYVDPAREYGAGFFDARRRVPDLTALRAALGDLPARPWREIVGACFREPSVLGSI